MCVYVYGFDVVFYVEYGEVLGVDDFWVGVGEYVLDYCLFVEWGVVGFF